MSKIINGKEYLDYNEAADEYGLSRKSIQSMVSRGVFTNTKFERDIKKYISRHELEKYKYRKDNKFPVENQSDTQQEKAKENPYDAEVFNFTAKDDALSKTEILRLAYLGAKVEEGREDPQEPFAHRLTEEWFIALFRNRMKKTAELLAEPLVDFQASSMEGAIKSIAIKQMKESYISSIIKLFALYMLDTPECKYLTQQEIEEALFFWAHKERSIYILFDGLYGFCMFNENTIQKLFNECKKVS